MTPVTRLAKVILYCQNMDAQVRFWRDVIGLPLQSPAGLLDYSAEYWVEFDAGSCQLVLHGGGGKRIGQDAPKLAFAVADIHAAHAELTMRGAPLGDIRSPAPDVYVSDGVDPEGNSFSIDAFMPSSQRLSNAT